jgi:crotonobetainyl-CoA:carnitine CoA-transferase CaiB-like acyl-CoA transferase
VARNPFVEPLIAGLSRAEVDKLARVVRTYLTSGTVAQLRARLVAAGVPAGVANTVAQLDDVPDAVLRLLHPRLADDAVWDALRARLGLS